MKTLKIITIMLLIALNAKTDTYYTISGYIKGDTPLNSSCGDIYMSYQDTTYNEMHYDTAYGVSGSTGKRYSLTVRAGARGFLKAEREGFIFTPSNLFVGPVLSNKGDIHFTAEDTMHPEIIFTQIPNNAILNTTDTVKFKIYDNSTFTAQTWVYFTNDNNNYRIIASKGEINNWYFQKEIINLDTVSDLNRIKIVTIDTDGNETTNYSDLFSVIDTARPTITLNSPIETDIWTLGETQNITWVASDNDSLLYREIYYSHTNNVNWILLNKDTSNTGSYSWVIPEHYSTTCKVRIIVYDVSNNSNTIISKTFTIRENIKPTVSIITPTTNTQIKKGTTYDITWTASDNIEVTAIKLDISVDNGLTYFIQQNLAKDITTYTWAVPSTESENCKVRVTAFDASGNECTIYSGTFKIVKMDGQAPTISIEKLPIKLFLGFSWTVRFEASDNDTITYRIIYFSSDSGKTFERLDSAKWSGGKGTFSWKIDVVSDFCQFKVKVSDISNNHVTSTSNIFEVVDETKPGVLITSPSELEAGKEYAIKWVAVDNHAIDYVNLYFSSDSGKTYSLITTDSANLGEYLWTVPAMNKTGCYIRMEAFDASANKAEVTTNMFKIFVPTNIKHWVNAPKEFGVKISLNSFIISMEKAEKVNITLISLNGRTIINENKNLKAGFHTIARSHIARGMYILTIKRMNKIIVKKIY